MPKKKFDSLPPVFTRARAEKQARIMRSFGRTGVKIIERTIYQVVMDLL